MTGAAATGKRLSLQRVSTLAPLLPIAFGGPHSSTFTQRIFLVGPSAPFAAGPGLLLGLVPVGKELLRCLAVAPLHVAHVRNVVGVLVPVSEGARLASLLEQAQVVGALVIACVARSEDCVAGVG